MHAVRVIMGTVMASNNLSHLSNCEDSSEDSSEDSDSLPAISGLACLAGP